MRDSRRLLAAVAAAVIAVGAFEPFYLKVFRVDGERMRAMLVELPYRKTPGLRTFLEGVRARTRPGDSIVIAAPYATWQGGYDYVYARATYVLSGRRVLPLRDPESRPQPQSLGRAQFVAAYRMNAPLPNFVPVWSGPDGMLLRRVK